MNSSTTAVGIRRHALVLGGTGAIGVAVLRGLAQRGVPTTFTYLRSSEKAVELASETGHTAVQIDLSQPAALRAMFVDLDRRGIAADVLIHCAAIHRAAPLAEIADTDFDLAVAVSGRAAFVAVQEFASRLAKEKDDARPPAGGRPGHVVIVSALERAQSVPLTPSFAAAQGMLAPLAMALAKELGPRNIRVNVVAGGLIGEGVSRGIDPKRMRDFEKFSALRRLGTSAEIAAAVVFLALDNDYMSGKTLAANGGI